jgi:hypothetical protein
VSIKSLRYYEYYRRLYLTLVSVWGRKPTSLSTRRWTKSCLPLSFTKKHRNSSNSWVIWQPHLWYTRIPGMHMSLWGVCSMGEEEK